MNMIMYLITLSLLIRSLAKNEDPDEMPRIP